MSLLAHLRASSLTLRVCDLLVDLALCGAERPPSPGDPCR